MENFTNFLMIALFLYFIFEIPGKALLINFERIGGNGFDEYPLNLLTGLLIFTIVSIISYYFRLKIETLISIQLIISFLAFIYLLKQIKFEKKNSLNLKGIEYLLIFAAIFFIYTFSNISTLNTDAKHSDYWYFLAQTRSFISGDINNFFPFGYEITNSYYPFNTYNSLLALISGALSIDPIIVYEQIKIIFLLALFLFSYKFVFIYVQERSFTTIITISYFFVALLTQNSSSHGWKIYLLHIGLPKIISGLSLILIYVALLKKIEDLNFSVKLFFNIVFGFIFMHFHIENIFFYFLILASFNMGYLIIDKKINKEFLQISFITIAFLSIYYLLFLHNFYIQSDPRFQISRTENVHLGFMLIELINGWYLANPLHFFSFNSQSIVIKNFLVINSILLIFLYKFNLNKELKIIFLGLITVLGITLFFPPVFTLAAQVIPIYVFERILLTFPFILSFIWLYQFVVQTNFIKKINLSFIYIILSIGFFAISLNIKVLSGNLIKENKEFYDFLQSNVEEKSFIYTDYANAFHISAFKHIRLCDANKMFASMHIPNDIKIKCREVEKNLPLGYLKLDELNPDYIIVFKKDSKFNEKNVDMDLYNEIFNSKLHQIYKKIS
jgi:hypothetical protein